MIDVLEGVRLDRSFALPNFNRLLARQYAIANGLNLPSTLAALA